MPQSELMREGEHMMTVCNACRYCEGFCAVWPAMEYRRTFGPGELKYLANLCHNCTECYYACQYAPPHEWMVNPPQTFAKVRAQSYEEYAWPGWWRINRRVSRQPRSSLSGPADLGGTLMFSEV